MATDANNASVEVDSSQPIFISHCKKRMSALRKLVIDAKKKKKKLPKTERLAVDRQIVEKSEEIEKLRDRVTQLREMRSKKVKQPKKKQKTEDKTEAKQPPESIPPPPAKPSQPKPKPVNKAKPSKPKPTATASKTPTQYHAIRRA